MNALRSGAMLRAGADCAAVLARDCMPYRTCDQDAQSPYAQEPDFADWAHRLEIFRDFRDRLVQ